MVNGSKDAFSARHPEAVKSSSYGLRQAAIAAPSFIQINDATGF
jgi:hypothetical protein